jgi:hypothetical protein
MNKESDLQFFWRYCEDILWEKRIEIGLSPWVFVSFLPSKKKKLKYTF